MNLPRKNRNCLSGDKGQWNFAACWCWCAVFGCAYPTLPSNMHIAATSTQAIRIKCNATDESWTLKCVADTWVGLIGNCTVSEYNMQS